jgi:dihydroorotase
VLYTRLVKTGRISLDRLVEVLSTAPRRIFRLPEAPEDWVEVDLDTPWIIRSAEFASMGRATPFEGWEVYGKILRTVMNGKTVYNNLTK